MARGAWECREIRMPPAVGGAKRQKGLILNTSD